MSSVILPDVDECQTTNECQFNQICVNRPGGYSCTCPRGYRSASPGQPCVGQYYSSFVVLRTCSKFFRSLGLLCIPESTDRLPCHLQGGPKNWHHCFYDILTHFQNCFTVRIKRKLVIRRSIKIAPHLKCIAIR